MTESQSAATVVESAAVLLIAVAVGSLLFRELSAAIWSITAQAVLLVAIAVAVAISTGELHAWIAAGLVLVVKVVAIPLVLFRALEHVHLKREVQPVLPERLVVALGVALAIAAYQLAPPLRAAAAPGALAPALGLMLIGLMMMILRRKALSQAIGLVTLENGIYLAALASTGGLPLAVELAVALDVLVGAVVMAILVQRIGQTFQTINVDQLNRLRDRPRSGAA